MAYMSPDCCKKHQHSLVRPLTQNCTGDRTTLRMEDLFLFVVCRRRLVLSEELIKIVAAHFVLIHVAPSINHTNRSQAKYVTNVSRCIHCFIMLVII